MQHNFPQDLLSSHACLCNLEDELKKERNLLLQNLNVGVSNSNRSLYASFFPMLAKYTEFAEQYVMQLANFKKLFQHKANQLDTNKPKVSTSNIVNIAPNQRQFSTTNNGNYVIDNHEVKQTEIHQTHLDPINDENETKLSSLYDENTPKTQTQQRRKPPVKSSTHVHIPVNNNLINNNINNNSKKIVSVAIKKPRNRQIVVARHKYRHNDRDFQIFWKRNFQRPMYTLTTLKINKTFGGNDKLVKKFLHEKGGFQQALIEQITFIGRNNHNKINKKLFAFTLVRYRASLSYIFHCIARIDESEGYGIVIKQNNRGKKNNNMESNKLYVNNFDILDKNCHVELTNIFCKFGELERDIFIGKDKKTRNPYAKVEFREICDAIGCMEIHSNFNTTIYFPQRMHQFEDGGNVGRKYLNRKLHIEYNIPRDSFNSFNKNFNRGRNKGRNNNNSRR